MIDFFQETGVLFHLNIIFINKVIITEIAKKYVLKNIMTYLF